MRNQKKAGFRKLSGMNKVSLNADKHEGRFMNRAMKSMPWLICASAAWLTLVPCEMAFADIPDDNKVHYDQKGEEAGGTVKDGKLIIDASVASEAVPKTGKDYFTSNWAKAGNATNGQTTIQSGVTIGTSPNVYYVSGSLASIGTATNSSVTATNAIVYGDIIGGDGTAGSHNNSVTLDGTKISRAVYGGRCDNNPSENDSASDNSVSVLHSSIGDPDPTKVGDSAAGGLTNYGNAQRNTLTFTDSIVDVFSGVFGGSTWNGIASNNVLEVLSGSKIQSLAYPVAGGFASHGTANSNTVTISGISSVTSTVYGGYASAEASSNTVGLSDSTAAISLYGGYANEGTANSNSVTGTNSTVGWDVYGGAGSNWSVLQ